MTDTREAPSRGCTVKRARFAEGSAFSVAPSAVSSSSDAGTVPSRPARINQPPSSGESGSGVSATTSGRWAGTASGALRSVVSAPRVASTRASFVSGGTSTGTCARPRASAVTGPKRASPTATTTSAPGAVDTSSVVRPSRGMSTGVTSGGRPSSTQKASTAHSGWRTAGGVQRKTRSAPPSTRAASQVPDEAAARTGPAPRGTRTRTTTAVSLPSTTCPGVASTSGGSARATAASDSPRRTAMRSGGRIRGNQRPS
ncbi:hypothetical protein COSO111634_25695 [Corallococcus soli]